MDALLLKKKYEQWHTSSGTMNNIVSPSQPYFCHFRDSNKSRYDPSLCLRRNSQDVEFGIQNIKEAITIIDVSSK
jgi:hypothetical protein